jgi:phosphoserine phosphatase
MDPKCKYYCYKKTREKNHYKTKNPEKIKLVLFDMDGVLTDTMSSWKYIHDYYGTCNDQSVDEYLKGNIDDMEFIKRDVTLWQKKDNQITREKLLNILSDIPLMKGAEKCINYLKERNIETAIISAGLDVLAEKVADELDITHVFSNGIKTDEKGYIHNEGLLKVELMYKDKNVISLSKKLDIPFEGIAAVGNSCFDIPMFEVCSLGIAFNPEDDCTRQAADIVIEEKDLTKIIPYIIDYIS